MTTAHSDATKFDGPARDSVGPRSDEDDKGPLFARRVRCVKALASLVGPTSRSSNVQPSDGTNRRTEDTLRLGLEALLSPPTAHRHWSELDMTTAWPTLQCVRGGALPFYFM